MIDNSSKTMENKEKLREYQGSTCVKLGESTMDLGGGRKMVQGLYRRGDNDLLLFTDIFPESYITKTLATIEGPTFMSNDTARMIGEAVGMRHPYSDENRRCSCELNKFDKNDWAHMHDCVLHASDISFSQEELEKLFLSLPEEMRLEAELHGMNDTVWRDNLIKWLEEESKNH